MNSRRLAAAVVYFSGTLLLAPLLLSGCSSAPKQPDDLRAERQQIEVTSSVQANVEPRTLAVPRAQLSISRSHRPSQAAARSARPPGRVVRQTPPRRGHRPRPTTGATPQTIDGSDPRDTPEPVGPRRTAPSHIDYGPDGPPDRVPSGERHEEASAIDPIDEVPDYIKERTQEHYEYIMSHILRLEKPQPDPLIQNDEETDYEGRTEEGDDSGAVSVETTDEETTDSNATSSDYDYDAGLELLDEYAGEVGAKLDESQKLFDYLMGLVERGSSDNRRLAAIRATTSWIYLARAMAELEKINGYNASLRATEQARDRLLDLKSTQQRSP